jgi:uncharacterized Zn-finger protein
MSKITACTKRRYEITQEDLPLCCPMPDMKLWDAHPRVYMPIHETGHERCPYCSAEYILIDFKPSERK